MKKSLNVSDICCEWVITSSLILISFSGTAFVLFTNKRIKHSSCLLGVCLKTVIYFFPIIFRFSFTHPNISPVTRLFEEVPMKRTFILNSTILTIIIIGPGNGVRSQSFVPDWGVKI